MREAQCLVSLSPPNPHLLSRRKESCLALLSLVLLRSADGTRLLRFQHHEQMPSNAQPLRMHLGSFKGGEAGARAKGRAHARIHTQAHASPFLSLPIPFQHSSSARIAQLLSESLICRIAPSPPPHNIKANFPHGSPLPPSLPPCELLPLSRSPFGGRSQSVLGPASFLAIPSECLCCCRRLRHRSFSTQTWDSALEPAARPHRHKAAAESSRYAACGAGEGEEG